MRKICLLLSFCSLSLLSSCSIINLDAIYDANALNVPMHKAKHQLKGSAGYGSILGFNTDVSYAATSNLSVKAAANYNHQYLVRNRLLGTNHFDLKNHYLEGGIGYYKYLPQFIINSLELSAGYGNGLTKKGASDRFNGKYHKVYLQFNAGHLFEKAELGLGVRYSEIIYPQLYHAVRDRDYLESPEYNYSNLHLPTRETALMGAIGGEKLKFTLQYGLAIPFRKINVPLDATGYKFHTLNNWSAIFQVGIRYNLMLKNPNQG
jgi:hypothetical protein